MIECKLCRRPYPNTTKLQGHLKSYHQRECGSLQKYYDKFFKKSDEGICKLEGCTNPTNYKSFEKGYLQYCCGSHA